MMRKLVVAVGILWVVSCLCIADDYIWNDSAGGSFDDSAKWNPFGVPADNDAAFFTLPDTYTVTFPGEIFNDAIIVDGSDLTLDLNSYNYFLGRMWNAGRAVTIGPNTQSDLNILHGTVYSRDVSLGQFEPGIGNLTLSGSDAAWTTSYSGNWHGVWMGEEGDAHLSILNDAHFNHGHGNCALGGNSNVVVDVNGIDSEWYIDGQFDMSIFGNTTVNIANGGLVNIGQLTMGYYPGSSAQINVSGQSHESELQLHAVWENSLTIGKGGRAGIRVDGSKVWNQGTMTIAEEPGSSGSLELHEGTWADCGGSVAVGGTFSAPGGTGHLSIIDDDRTNGKGVEFTPTSVDGESVIVWPKGTITMDGGVIEEVYDSGQANPIILRGGTLEGSGMIWAHVVNLGGLVAPKDDQDQKLMEIGYDYTQDSTGTLKITIDGPDMISQYSKLEVTNPAYGQVVLNGMLDVELANGFVPDYNDQFIIVSATYIIGTFSNAPLKYVFENGSFDVMYNPDSVILTHFDPLLTCSKYPLADINKDCKVNMTDLSILAVEWLECNLVPASNCP